ncbi:E3 ubiquitin protein ligase RIN2-like protein [Drosera capensis]
MGANYLTISAISTVLSLIGLQCWTEMSLENLKADGLIDTGTIYSDNFQNVIDLVLRSHATVALLALSIVNVFVLLILCLKTLFFGELVASETRKLVERLVNYVIYKGTFLPLIIPPTFLQSALWFTWLTVLCSLKMFQALARDRLERLNASPSVTPKAYFRVYSALLLVLAVDLFWIWFCVKISGALGASTIWLLFFKPLSIAFETLQAIVVHGFQWIDVWLHHSSADIANYQSSKIFNTPLAGNLWSFHFALIDMLWCFNCLQLSCGSLWEWKGSFARNMGFVLDMMRLLMALGHYALIWWLHGMTFHLVDGILFLRIRALLSAIVKRVKGFIKLRIALGALHGALPNATSDEIKVYDDECAICREPMAKAKKLPCNHLFHLACLRSWLDQGLNEVYSCPTCRKPLFAGRTDHESSSRAVEVSNDEQLAHQLSAGLDHTNAARQEAFPNQSLNSFDAGPWRGAGLDSSWLPPWSGQDGAGPSNAIRSVGLNRVQMMMRQLASVGETYAQSALEDSSWSFWPPNTNQATTSGAAFPPATTPVYHTNLGTLHTRPARPADGSIANLLAMAETVHEVLPHVPDEMIFQDLQRTNSVTVTVNNLLQM